MDVPQQQVAGFNPQQQQAFGLASSGLGAFQPYLNTASQYAQAATGAYDPTGQTAGQVGYQDYMNPYQQHVTAGIESQFQKLQNQASAQAGRVGAFGGARQGVQSAELGRQQAESVGQSLAQNYGQAQQQAQQQFAGQMGRYGQAATQMAGLGGQQQQQQQSWRRSVRRDASFREYYSGHGGVSRFLRRHGISTVEFDAYQTGVFDPDLSLIHL